ncbi:MAG: metallophosphoesterase family protein [Lentisphaerales bacterium]|nr:metallophosphoesterase family protein [Lentisphaerales bacterium]
MKFSSLLVSATLLLSSCKTAPEGPVAPLTHGPMLGKQTSSSITVWARTKNSTKFHVRYGLSEGAYDNSTEPIITKLENDNTGTITLSGLEPGKKYHYAIFSGDKQVSPPGSFKTLRDGKTLKTDLNPDGLFNFSFEFACGNNQSPNPAGLGPTMPAYDTLNAKVRDKIDFAILNGDWLYEEDRDYPADKWIKQTNATHTPKIVDVAPVITGVWENYKTYMSRPKNLAEWHRHVPTYYTFDDHELLNDVFGCGEEGYRNRRAVIRDIATEGWYDYLGWANFTETQQGIHFGKGQMTKGSDIIVDKSADFTKIDLDQAANLHVHWNTPNAAVKDIPQGDTEGGDPNANVYSIVEVLDKHRIQVSPAAAETKTSSYSIGRRSYGSFKVSNCRFIFLDTKTHREMHDTKNPGKKGISMIGKKQREWMMNLMKKKDADFYFLISSVNFMVPHVGGGGHHFDAATKDDAWTVFLDEREKLINFWDKLNKRVFVLSGDLHNSYSVKITDNVWEFASGPHNSVNHRPEDEGNRPINGKFKYGPRECDIRWSTYARNDIPRANRLFPHYCVIDIRNVFNNPIERDGERLIPFVKPHVLFQFYDGLTGELKYAEPIHAK